MPQKVTIQDIADALGLSRNTVSKAINNTGTLADATRERILRKAQEMGYKQFSYMQLSDSFFADQKKAEKLGNKREIALLFTGTLGGSHFATTMIDRFQHDLSMLGFSLSIYRIMPEEIASCRLPEALNLDKTTGILCVEVFDGPYCRMLCGLGIPLLMADGPAIAFEGAFEADMLLMDNHIRVYEFVKEMVYRGKKTIGFVGNIHHCQSFYERFSALNQAAALYGMTETGSITDTVGDIDALKKKLDGTELPEVYFCANDFVALDLMRALKRKGLSVPEDIWICGYDDSPESRLVSPQLTSIHIHTQAIGQIATNMLYSRILLPESNYCTTYVETHLIYRESTGDY